MAGPRSGAVRRFTISPERISGDRVVFDAAETRHLVRVLRLHPGDLVIAADGHGHAYRVRILALGATATGAIVGGASAAEESALTISLVQGIPKGDQMDAVVRAATELGVARIRPAVTERTVVRLDASFRPEVLRKGTNGMVCIADAPNDDRFDVRCYRDTFIPVVYRAFQLGYQVSGEKVEAEIKAGKLQLSPEPTAGYRCLGPISGYDSSRNAVTAQVECWQSIHFPFRTAAEVGFPDEHDVSESQQRETPT